MANGKRQTANGGYLLFALCFLVFVAYAAKAASATARDLLASPKPSADGEGGEI